jgi:metaxin
MSSTFSIPAPLLKFYSLWPLHTWPPIPPPKSPPTVTTLWILPPRDPDLLLSSDVECLKWQAFVALRGVEGMVVRWDVSPDGGVDGRLPALHVPRREGEGDEAGGELLAAHMIPGWVDKILGAGAGGAFEGYKDEAARDESHAWVSLLEGKVHAALVPSPLNSPHISHTNINPIHNRFSPSPIHPS